MRTEARLLLVLLALVTALLAGSCEPGPQTPPELVADVIEAHGGREQLKGAETLLFHGQIEALLQQKRGHVWILYQRPDRLRVIVEFADSREDRLYLAGRGWRDSGNGFVEVSGPSLQAMAFQLQHLDLPYRLSQEQYRATFPDAGADTETLKVLDLTGQDGFTMRMAVDARRKLVSNVEMGFVVGGQQTSLAVVYEDYRKVQGVELSHRVLNFAAGRLIARTFFDTVQVNAPLPGPIFELSEDGLPLTFVLNRGDGGN